MHDERASGGGTPGGASGDEGHLDRPAVAGSAPAADSAPARPRRRRKLGPAIWEGWSDERLLGVRICDLDLSLGSLVGKSVATLNGELADRGLLFRPHIWLSDEWFTPDGVPGVAVPFYLAHPRLAKLEMHQVFEVEGGTRKSCLRILRHECGHAIENAFRLRRRRRRRELFGSTTEPYPEFYSPRPYSKSFVIHLDSWYAQSHPDEDFAETFAVWLDPESNWRQRYQGWQALRKLEYVDELMRELAGQEPPVTRRDEPNPLSSFDKTLRAHYQEKRDHYGVDRPQFYDRDLRRLFSDAREYRKNPTAASFLSRHRTELRQLIGRWTHEYQYTIDAVLTDIVERCQELKLHLVNSPEQAKLDVVVLLAVQTMNYLHSGNHRVAM